MQPPLVIGLIGGIGSGKSFLSRELAKRTGVITLDADRLGHEVLERPEVKQSLVSAFGSEILDASGKVIRKVLGEKVFRPEDPEPLELLEKIVHPPLVELLSQRIQEAREKGTQAIVLDAPLLLEKGWDRFCNLIWFVEVSESERLRRVQLERGWGPNELFNRELRQWPLDKKRSAAHDIIINDGPNAVVRLNQLFDRAIKLLDA